MESALLPSGARPSQLTHKTPGIHPASASHQAVRRGTGCDNCGTDGVPWARTFRACGKRGGHGHQAPGTRFYLHTPENAYAAPVQPRGAPHQPVSQRWNIRKAPSPASMLPSTAIHLQPLLPYCPGHLHTVPGLVHASSQRRCIRTGRLLKTRKPSPLPALPHPSESLQCETRCVPHLRPVVSQKNAFSRSFLPTRLRGAAAGLRPVQRDCGRTAAGRRAGQWDCGGFCPAKTRAAWRPRPFPATVLGRRMGGAGGRRATLLPKRVPFFTPHHARGSGFRQLMPIRPGRLLRCPRGSGVLRPDCGRFRGTAAGLRPGGGQVSGIAAGSVRQRRGRRGGLARRAGLRACPQNGTARLRRY